MNGKITYRQQFTRCGKPRCRKCREGAGHGPYWYAYWSEKGRTVSKYIGVSLPATITTTTEAHIDEKIPELPSPQPIQPALKVFLLGQFRIEHFNHDRWQSIDSRTWHRRRARALLGCLLSNPGRRIGREQVMEQLWPDLDVDIAANRLNGAVHELRQILEPDLARPASSRLLRLERDILELADNQQIWVDAEAFELLLKQAEAASDPDEIEQLLEQASELYRGSYLLEELYSEWAAPRRDALQRAWVGLLLKQADLRATKGAYVAAIEVLDRLRAADPTNETALQRLMQLLTYLDRRGEALQIYRHYIAMLRREYEGEPLPETRELFEMLRQGHMPPLALTRPLAMSATTATSLIETETTDTPSSSPSLPLTPATSTSTSLDHDHPGYHIQKQQSPDFVITRPVFQLGRHNQSPLVGRDRELTTMKRLLQTIGSLALHDQQDDVHTLSKSTHARPLSPPSRPQLPHFLLLKGEAGIGKTRLAEEISLEAYQRGWIVAWSRSYEQERSIPYRPWTELLRTLLHSTSIFKHLSSLITSQETSSSQSSPSHTLSPLKLERLSALLPELSSFSSSSLMTRHHQALPHEQERLHLWEAALSLLSTLSKLHPLLLVFDDVHWADDSSIELLTYLTHHLYGQRILLVGTCRDGEVQPHQKIHTLTVDLQKEQAITVIPVHPLTQSQIGSLLSYLPHDVVQSIQTQASGNPFFAEELARYVAATDEVEDVLLTSSQTLSTATSNLNQNAAHTSSIVLTGGGINSTPPADLNLPEAIAAVLERRLSRLSQDCQNLLSKAAVLGGSFELNLLLPMAPEFPEDTLLDLLDEALHSGLLTEEGTGAHITYHFWHPLIISHLYGRLSAGRRALLHRRAAEAIKAAHLTQPAKGAAAICNHLRKGGCDTSAIAHYAELAGNSAFSLSAYWEAQQYYLQAIQALIASGKNVTTLDESDRQAFIAYIMQTIKNHLHTLQTTIADPLHVCRLLERVAECSSILGEYEQTRHLFECALELRSSELFERQMYGQAFDEKELQRQEAQMQALLWREIGMTWSSIGEYDRAYACYRRGKEVISAVGITSGAAWACIHLQYGATLRVEGNYHEARRYLQEALTMLEHVAQTRRASPDQSTSSNTRGDFLTRTERAFLGDPLEIGHAHERLGIVAASLGHHNDALKHMHTALSIYEKSDLISVMARVYGNLGAVYITKGEHAAAYEYMQNALHLAERAGITPTMAFIMHNLGDVAQRTGKLQEAEEHFKQSFALSERVNDREHMSWCNVALAAVQVDLGKMEEAAAHLYRAIQIGRTIKSTRCICYALVGLADFRIAQALMLELTSKNDPLFSVQQRKLILRAQTTLQRAIALAGMEVENIIDGKHLLASTYFLLKDFTTALHIEQHILKEAQSHEMTRIIGRTNRLVGRILVALNDFEQAEHFFQQAIRFCQERDLRVEYARALCNYGAALVQYPFFASRRSEGLHYLEMARDIFSECHAALDLALLMDVLKHVT